MGKDFIPLGINHIGKEKAIRKLYKAKFVESASKEEYFHKLPNKDEIAEVEIGSSGTKESVFRLKNGDFIEVNKTMKLNKIKDVS